jgi:hypothetical protein
MNLHAKLGITSFLFATTLSFAHIDKTSLSVKGGETFKAQEKVTVTWNAAANNDHNMASWTFWYSKDGGTTWTSVKSAIPGKASTATISYEWTVPSDSTRLGKIRVHQSGYSGAGTPGNATNDYTIITPVFTITAAATAIRATASAPTAASASLTAEGNTIAIRFLATESRSASVEVYDMNGTLQNTMALAGVKVGANLMNLSAKDLGLTGKSVLRLRIGGEVVVEELIGGLK